MAKFRFVLFDKEIWRFELDVEHAPPVPEPVRQVAVKGVKRFSHLWFKGMIS